MKLLKIMLLFIVVFSMIKCQDQDENELETQSTSQDQIPEETLAKIAHMGFNITDISVKLEEGGYIVEGDIFISSEEVENIDFSKQRYEKLMSCSRSRNIKVKNALPKGVMRKAVASAIRNWNKVNGSFLKMRLVNKGQDILIRSDRGSLRSDFSGLGTFPAKGRAGNLIKINVDYKTSKGTPLNFQQWRFVIEHELGHNIGFRHTNNVGGIGGTLVSGTPESDANSLMNGSTTGQTYNLSANDKKALVKMYGGKNSLCK